MNLRPSLTCALLLFSSRAAAWDPPARLTNAQPDAFNPSVYVSSAGTHLVYMVPDSAGRWSPVHADDSSGALSDGAVIGAGMDARWCKLSCDPAREQHVVVTCVAYRQQYGKGCEAGVGADGCGDYWVIESHDGGLSWAAPYRPPHDHDFMMRYGCSHAHDEHGNLIAAYEGDERIRSRRRAADSEVWSNEELVTPGGLGQEHSAVVAATDAFVHVVFRTRLGTEDRLWHTRSDGMTWSVPKRISLPPMSAGTLESALVTDGHSTLDVVYQHSGSGVYGAAWLRSIDDGASWPEPRTLCSPCFIPTVTRDWRGHLFGLWSVGYSTIVAAEFDGSQWLAPATLSQPADSQRAVSIAAGPGVVRAVWHSNQTGAYQVYLSSLQIPIQPETLPDAGSDSSPPPDGSGLPDAPSPAEGGLDSGAADASKGVFPAAAGDDGCACVAVGVLGRGDGSAWLFAAVIASVCRRRREALRARL